MYQRDQAYDASLTAACKTGPGGMDNGLAVQGIPKPLEAAAMAAPVVAPALSGLGARAKAASGGGGSRLALGLSKHLFDFAAKHNAKTVFSFPRSWKLTVLDALDSEQCTILFNRQGVDPGRAMNAIKAGNAEYTNWELQQIHETPEAWHRVEFHNDWKPGSSNPFPFGQ